MRYVLLAAVTVLLYVLFPCSAAMADELQGMTEILDVRVNDEDGKLRIVVDADAPVSIRKMALSDPERVVVDIKNAWVSPRAKRNIFLWSDFASRLRVAQFDERTVRVVVEIKNAGKNYNVFTIDEGSPPGRVVLDFGDTDLSRQRGESLKQENKEKEQKQEKEKQEKEKEKKEKEQKEREKKEKQERERQEKERKEREKQEREREQKQEKEKDKKKDQEKSSWWEEIGKISGKESSTDRQIDEITGLKGKSIAIDAGHGGSDSGAIGPTGVMEKSVTLRIALEVEKLLKEEGATVYMTRTTDTEVSPKGARASDSEELQARCDVANRKKADIFVSIHMDSFTNREAKGTTGYYFSQGSRQGRELADKIRSNLVDQLGTQSRGTQTCNFYVVRHTDMPATLIEVAFISNPEEERLLNSKEGIKKAAMAIVDGIADYFG